MEKNKFFRFVWRFNAIFIALAGLGAISALGFGLILALFQIMRINPGNNIVNTDKNNQIEEKLKFADFREITGTPYVMVPLYLDQFYRKSYSGENPIRNYLFVDSETGVNNWLFKNNQYLIIRDSFIVDSPKNISIVAAILYQIIKKDTNSDRQLTEKDGVTLALTQPNGSNYKEILEDIDKLLGYKLTTKDSIFILYEKDGVAYSVRFFLNNFTILNQVQLPKISD